MFTDFYFGFVFICKVKAICDSIYSEGNTSAEPTSRLAYTVYTIYVSLHDALALVIVPIPQRMMRWLKRRKPHLGKQSYYYRGQGAEGKKG